MQKERYVPQTERTPQYTGVISYKRSFGDLNETHLKIAQAIGIRPLATRKEAEAMKEKLRHIATNDFICGGLADAFHSVPYSGSSLPTDTIGYNFLIL